MKVKKMPFKEYKKIYSIVPRLCVEVILLTNKGIALTKRDIPPAIGKWHIPGGTVLKGENLVKAVKRLAQEELEENIEVQKMLGVIEYNFTNYFDQPVGIAFLVKLKDNNSLNDKNKKYKLFKDMPQNMIKAQKDFIIKHKKELS
ncbi:MAG TPA: NUDIX hydrolase [Patescibacteria group bacterium]|nr:NUDIX hydrolase [Patescibacteria group bacterium]